MSLTFALAGPLLFSLVAAQTPDNTAENHPKLTTYKCTTDGGCTAQNTALVLDASSHHIYQSNAPDSNCGDWGSGANATACPDEETCQQNCVLQGIPDYTANGVHANGSDLTLLMLSSDGKTEYSPRIYLLNEAEDAYEMLQLTGQEFTFDVDMSKLPCGMNSALYLSEMEATGGKDSSDLSVAGAEYGAGYCDAQCYTTPFINGLGNINGSGVCCNELDIWEANARATHIAPHPCNVPGLYACDANGEDCGDNGVCDKSGCSMNPYKMGHPEYYGLDLEVDTTRPFTVVTQFPSDQSGQLTAIRRLYIQDGKTIEMPISTVEGVPAQNFLNDEYCNATGADKYMDLGATGGMGAAMSRGMVLVFSIWWDKGGFMQWLDGQSSNAGPCNATEGNPEIIGSIQPDTQVTFSQIRWGDIGSTFSGSTNGTGGTNGSGSAVSSVSRRRMAEGLAFHS
ncbi:hypothetical protein SLS63_002785 [Diaporthe eres]|uniref:Glucanase n=1 Tax=Diaporthe eres TaxID=83184 RepID=A0ABR1PIU9_DIAER